MSMAEVRADAIASDRPIVSNPDRVFDKFQRESYVFPHALADHPLFTLNGLQGFAERLPDHPGFAHWQTGKIDFSDGWSTNPGAKLTLPQTLETIAENDGLVVLKHAEQDAVYGPVLRDVLSTMYAYAPQSVRDDIVLGESIIFISSPNRRTVYHMDLESSFLLQVAGEKIIHVFNQADRTMVTERELEQHCDGDQNGAVFKPERIGEANKYHLKPGIGVHFPSTAPHMVENGPQVSISVNINYDHRSVHHRLRHIYRMNKMLRRFGLTPTPPGRVAVLDEMKVALDKSRAGVGRMLRGSQPGRDYPQWTPN